MNIKNIMTSAGLVTSLLVSASSQALVMSDSTEFVFPRQAAVDSSVEQGPVTSETSETYYLSRFDSSLGVLTSVTLGMKSEWIFASRLDVSGEGGRPDERRLIEVRATSFDDEEGEDQFDREHDFDDDDRYSGAGESTLDMDVALTGAGVIDDSYSLTNSCVGFEGCRDGDDSSGDFDILSPPLTLDLGFFIGTDPLEFLLTHVTSANLDECDGECSQGAASSWGGKLYVEYSYDEKSVPEPSILGLLGLGLLGVSGASAFRRRRG